MRSAESGHPTEREKRLAAALAEYDGVIETAVSELAKRDDKDFFWEQRVADFIEVAKALRRRHRGLIRG